MIIVYTIARLCNKQVKKLKVKLSSMYMCNVIICNNRAVLLKLFSLCFLRLNKFQVLKHIVGTK